MLNGLLNLELKELGRKHHEYRSSRLLTLVTIVVILLLGRQRRPHRVELTLVLIGGVWQWGAVDELIV